jgi:hypothetical protein
MTAARNYSNTAASAVLTSGASAVDTTIQVDTTSGFPSVPFSSSWTRTGWLRNWCSARPSWALPSR